MDQSHWYIFSPPTFTIVAIAMATCVSVILPINRQISQSLLSK